MENWQQLGFDYPAQKMGNSLILQADCLVWLDRLPKDSLHAVVTDPPYGVKEYEFDQLEKRSNGKGGIWRIPPSFDGHQPPRCLASPRSTTKNAIRCACFSGHGQPK